MAKIDWGRMTVEEIEVYVREGFAQLQEDSQIQLIVNWVDELGGPENFVWKKEN